MSGFYLKGALIQFMETFLIPLPNVILFQYNPESITHTWSPSDAAPSADASENANPLGVAGNPGESFSFKLVMDALDQLAANHPVALVSGIYTRIAALEMLLYPTSDVADSELVGTVSEAVGGAADSQSVPAAQLPTTLFVWGPGRILPVRVTRLIITETLYDGLLNPTHAEADIELQVLTPEELAYLTGPLADIAKAAYAFSQGQRQILAVANLANSVESVIGILPL